MLFLSGHESWSETFFGSANDPPPLPCPLTCIASPAEDQAQGEEGNPWQGSPRSLFSPGPAHQATLPPAACPAQHLNPLTTTMQDGEMR